MSFPRGAGAYIRRDPADGVVGVDDSDTVLSWRDQLDDMLAAAAAAWHAYEATRQRRIARARGHFPYPKKHRKDVTAR